MIVLDAPTRAAIKAAAANQTAKVAALAAAWDGGDVTVKLYEGATQLDVATYGPWVLDALTPRGMSLGARSAYTALAQAATAPTLTEFLNGSTVIFTLPASVGGEGVSFAAGVLPSAARSNLSDPAGKMRVTADASLPVGDGYPADGLAREIIFIGNSLTEDAFASTPFYWLLARLTKRLNNIANSGFSGVSAFGLIGQIDSDYTLATGPGWGNLPVPAGVGFIRPGLTNTLRFGAAFDSGVQADLTTLIAKALTYVSFLYVFATPPIGTDSGVAANVAASNVWLAAACAADPTHLYFVDDAAPVRNPDGTAITNCFSDSPAIHMNGRGLRLMGIEGASIVEPTLVNQSWPTALAPDGALTEYISNPDLTGTGGSKGTGCTGTLPDGTHIEFNGSGGALTVAIVPAATLDPTDPDTRPWIAITPTVSSATSAIQVSFTGAGTITDTVPGTVETQLEVWFSGFSKYDRLDFWAQAGGHRFNKFLYAKWDTDDGANERLLMQKKFYRIDTAAAGTPTIYLQLSGSPDYTGSMGTIYIRKPSIRGQA